MKGIFFLLWLSFICLISSAQEIVPTELKQFKPERQLTNFLPLDSTEQTKPFVNYHLILSHGKWYAIGNGDGQVFTPENGKWKRIDKTRLEGYHYGAFLFDCNGTLMKYGGYGFWRNHGMFVYFHEHLGDWQIKPSDRDLPFSGNLAFFSRKENALYSFGNYHYNQSMSEEKIYLDSLYRIDLLQMKWKSLGKLNEILRDKYHLHFRLNSLPNSKGCFILPISTDSTALFFNFETLKYAVYNSKNNPYLFKFFSELPSNQQVYSDVYGIKILSNDTFANSDSIDWEHALENPIEMGELLHIEQPNALFRYSMIATGIGLISGILLIYYLYKKKNKLKNTKQNVAPVNGTPTLDLSILNTIIFEGAMYPIDSSDYFVIGKLSQQDASTLDLNEWLGLENKQPENQKKQRADWIKRMNAFFNSIGFKEEAFNRERQETDKRMFVYKMNTKLKQTTASINIEDEK